MVILRNFICKNLYSYKEETVLNLVASDSDAHKDFLYDPEGKRILSVISIYGANASGKSNLIKALNSMLYNIAYSPNEIEGVPFYFIEGIVTDKTIRQLPMSCEFEVGIGEKVYKYGYIISKKTVEKEWFFERNYCDKKFKQNFIREDIEIKYFGKNPAISGLVPTVKQSPKNLFLHYAGKTNVSPYADIFAWCLTAVKPYEAAKQYRGSTYDEMHERLKDNDYNNKFLNFIKRFDPTIIQIEASGEKENMQTNNKNIYLYRNKPDGQSLGLNINIESDGTKKIFEIYPFLKAILDNGGLYIVDELDLRLHPWIVREFVRMFHEQQDSNKFRQLIFSAHSTACLSGQDLRLDEIYFVEKTKQSCSTLYRLAPDDNAMLSPDADFGKYYMLGQFGAIPKEFIRKDNIDGTNDEPERDTASNPISKS